MSAGGVFQNNSGAILINCGADGTGGVTLNDADNCTDRCQPCPIRTDDCDPVCILCEIDGITLCKEGSELIEDNSFVTVIDGAHLNEGQSVSATACIGFEQGTSQEVPDFVTGNLTAEGRCYWGGSTYVPSMGRAWTLINGGGSPGSHYYESDCHTLNISFALFGDGGAWLTITASGTTAGFASIFAGTLTGVDVSGTVYTFTNSYTVCSYPDHAEALGYVKAGTGGTVTLTFCGCVDCNYRGKLCFDKYRSTYTCADSTWSTPVYVSSICADQGTVTYPWRFYSQTVNAEDEVLTVTYETLQPSSRHCTEDGDCSGGGGDFIPVPNYKPKECVTWTCQYYVKVVYDCLESTFSDYIWSSWCIDPDHAFDSPWEDVSSPLDPTKLTFQRYVTGGDCVLKLSCNTLPALDPAYPTPDCPNCDTVQSILCAMAVGTIFWLCLSDLVLCCENLGGGIYRIDCGGGVFKCFSIDATFGHGICEAGTDGFPTSLCVECPHDTIFYKITIVDCP